MQMQLKELNGAKWPSGKSAHDCPESSSIDEWLGLPAGSVEAAWHEAAAAWEKQRPKGRAR